MTGQPFLCPDCGCPLQPLYDSQTGGTKGTIQDALEAHCALVHKNEPDMNA